MRVNKLYSGLIIAILLNGPVVQASAVSSLSVATGAPNGTYSTMFREMGKVCANTSFLKEKGTTGSLENIDLILGNQASLAFVQLDVLKAKEKIEKDPNVANVKTLFRLHDEEVHIFSLANATKGSLLKKTPIKSYNDLAGTTVGTIGGSYVTAQVLSAYTGVKYNVIQFKTFSDLVSAIQSGKVMGGIAVGGSPYAPISALPAGKFILQQIPESSRSKLASLYSPAKVNYPNLGGSVSTVSIPSVLVTRDFKTADKKQLLLSYAKCVKSKLVTLQETEGYHPKWNNISNQAVSWPYYK